MSKTLVLNARGGLGNRLLGLASAMVLARRNNASLQLYWPCGRNGTGTDTGYYSEFDDLIEPTGFTVVDKAYLIDVAGKQTTHTSLLGVGLADGVTYLSSHGVVLNSGVSYAQIHSELLGFKLTAPVLSEHAAIMAELPSEYTACMIRVRGHWKSKRWNPSVRFYKLLMRTPRDVYLCCDSNDVLDVMANTGTGRRVYRKKPGRLNTREQLVVVMAELLVIRDAVQYYGTPHSALDVLARIWRGDKPSAYPN